MWAGRELGVFNTWDECAKQTTGFAGAKFKSFPSEAVARAAFIQGDAAHVDYSGAASKVTSKTHAISKPGAMAKQKQADDYPTGPALCVDAACDTTRWVMECRGVWLGGERDGQEVFSFGPLNDANGNLGEFLALATALRLASEAGESWTVYCDSITAMAWVRKKQIRSVFLEQDDTQGGPNTGRAGAAVRTEVENALAWLKTHDSPAVVRKWETPRWGEIPADYGRK
ncbi:MAG: ribonuclease H family protein [Algisphaera sp.]